jgi:hypothetical protein
MFLHHSTVVWTKSDASALVPDEDCLVKVLSYEALCAQPQYGELCKRQKAYKTQEVRAYEHCFEQGLPKFFGVVKSVNSACQGHFNLSDRGGYTSGVKVHDQWESLCTLNSGYGQGFIAIAVFIVAVFVLFGMGVGLRQKHGEQDQENTIRSNGVSDQLDIARFRIGQRF